MDKAEEARIFKEKIHLAAKWRLDRLTEGVSIPIELVDISIDVEKLVMSDSNLESQLIPCCPDDIKPEADFYLEPVVSINGRSITPSITLQATKEGDIINDYSKVEEAILSDEERDDFSNVGLSIRRLLEAIVSAIIAEALIFGTKWALGLL